MSTEAIWNNALWSKSYPLFEKAKAIDNQGDFAAAIKQYEAGLSIFPTNVEQQLRLGADYDRLGQTVKAANEWRQAIQLAAGAGFGEERYCEGDKLLETRSFRDAYRAYFTAEFGAGGSVGSDMSVTYTDLGVAPLIHDGLAAAGAGNFPTAMRELESAWNKDPTLQDSNFFLAGVKYQAGDLRAARAYWETVLDHSDWALPGQNAPSRISLAAATLLLWLPWRNH
ncbi:MAG TPA: hypothetical protein VKF82_07990 [Candidatus Eremiobacteraceae bacterium]|nr:hypothetical protein [Candidatus Eremiobacteraceae bacterium]